MASLYDALVAKANGVVSNEAVTVFLSKEDCSNFLEKLQDHIILKAEVH